MRLELPKQKGKANQTKNVFFFGTWINLSFLPIVVSWLRILCVLLLYCCWTVGGRFCCWNMLCYTNMRQNSKSICFLGNILILFCTFTLFLPHSTLYPVCKLICFYTARTGSRPPTTQNTPVLLLLLYTNNLAKNCKRPKEQTKHTSTNKSPKVRLENGDRGWDAFFVSKRFLQSKI